MNSIVSRGDQASDEKKVSLASFDTLFGSQITMTDSRIIPFPSRSANQRHVQYQINNTYTGGEHTFITSRTSLLRRYACFVEAVEATDLYNTSTIGCTTWEVDRWMLEEAKTNYDPFVELSMCSRMMIWGNGIAGLDHGCA